MEVSEAPLDISERKPGKSGQRQVEGQRQPWAVARGDSSRSGDAV